MSNPCAMAVLPVRDDLCAAGASAAATGRRLRRTRPADGPRTLPQVRAPVRPHGADGEGKCANAIAGMAKCEEGRATGSAPAEYVNLSTSSPRLDRGDSTLAGDP
ncbi:hypothetical protein GCM10010466_65740 [Planomonospora alba]|uniref:Uncharacterized protein n=1 Tax=Planomonospora alba TaxID=161354 RepID=A0ABP6P417_9ACTN